MPSRKSFSEVKHLWGSAGGPCMIGDNAPRLHGGMGAVLPAEIDPQIDLFNICLVYCTRVRHPTDDDDSADTRQGSQ